MTAETLKLTATPIPYRHKDEILSTDQAAVDYNIPRRVLTDLRTSGGGPTYIKVSHRCVRYRRGDIEQWLSERTKRFTQQTA